MDTIGKHLTALQQGTKSAPSNGQPSTTTSHKQDPFQPFNPNIHPRAGYALTAVRSWVSDAIAGNGRALILYASSKRGNGYGNGKTLLAKCAG